MRKKICYHKVNVKKHSQNSHNSPRQVSFPNENRNSSAEFIILFFFLVLILFCTICIFPNFWTLLFQSCRLLEMFVTHRDVPFWGERHQRLPISIVSEIPPLPLSFVEPPPPPPLLTHTFSFLLWGIVKDPRGSKVHRLLSYRPLFILQFHIVVFLLCLFFQIAAGYGDRTVASVFTFYFHRAFTELRLSWGARRWSPRWVFRRKNGNGNFGG